MGAHWRSGGALEFGLSALHLGGGLRYITEAAPLSRTIKFGVAFHPLAFMDDHPEMGFPINRLSLLADVSSPENQSLAVSAGLEFAYGALMVRAGGRTGDYAGPGYTAGVGIALFRRSRNRPEIDFDYAFVDYGDLGIAHRAGLTIKFGDELSRREDDEPRSRWNWPWSKGEKDGNQANPRWHQENFEPINFGPSGS